MSLGYHLHRAIFQFVDTFRKDFWAMVIHHWVTVLLIIFSWQLGLTQIGAVVMLLHDPADIFLSLTKIGWTFKISSMKNTCFLIFAITFIIFRCIIMPYKIILGVMFNPIYICHTAAKLFVFA